MAFRKNCELYFWSKEYVGGWERKEKSGRGGKQKTTVGLGLHVEATGYCL